MTDQAQRRPQIEALAYKLLRDECPTVRITGRDIESLAGEISDAVECWFEARESTQKEAGQ